MLVAKVGGDVSSDANNAQEDTSISGGAVLGETAHGNSDDVHGTVEDHGRSTHVKLITGPSHEENPLRTESVILTAGADDSTYNHADGIRRESHELRLGDIITKSLSQDNGKEIREGIEGHVLHSR